MILQHNSLNGACAAIYLFPFQPRTPRSFWPHLRPPLPLDSIVISSLMASKIGFDWTRPRGSQCQWQVNVFEVAADEDGLNETGRGEETTDQELESWRSHSRARTSRKYYALFHWDKSSCFNIYPARFVCLCWSFLASDGIWQAFKKTVLGCHGCLHTSLLL